VGYSAIRHRDAATDVTTKQLPFASFIQFRGEPAAESCPRSGSGRGAGSGPTCVNTVHRRSHSGNVCRERLAAGSRTPYRQEVPVDTSEWTSPRLPPGSYAFEVIARNAGGDSVASNTVEASVGILLTPQVSQNLVAATRDRSVHLTWQPSVGGPAASGYVVEAAAAGSATFTPVAQVGEREWRIGGVPEGQWCERVRAYTQPAGAGRPPKKLHQLRRRVPRRRPRLRISRRGPARALTNMWSRQPRRQVRRAGLASHQPACERRCTQRLPQAGTSCASARATLAARVGNRTKLLCVRGHARKTGPIEPRPLELRNLNP
jgi:hypothetical protein